MKLTARDPFLIRGVMILSLSTGKKIGRGNDLVITSFHKKFYTLDDKQMIFIDINRFLYLHRMTISDDRNINGPHVKQIDMNTPSMV